MGGKARADLARQMLDRRHAIGGLRHHAETLRAELAAEVARQIGAGQIQQRILLLHHLLARASHHLVAQGSGIAAGDDHLDEAGRARRGNPAERDIDIADAGDVAKGGGV